MLKALVPRIKDNQLLLNYQIIRREKGIKD